MRNEKRSREQREKQRSTGIDTGMSEMTKGHNSIAVIGDRESQKEIGDTEAEVKIVNERQDHTGADEKGSTAVEMYSFRCFCICDFIRLLQNLRSIFFPQDEFLNLATGCLGIIIHEEHMFGH